jgi:hypothetical protein
MTTIQISLLKRMGILAGATCFTVLIGSTNVQAQTTIHYEYEVVDLTHNDYVWVAPAGKGGGEAWSFPDSSLLNTIGLNAHAEGWAAKSFSIGAFNAHAERKSTFKLTPTSPNSSVTYPSVASWTFRRLWSYGFDGQYGSGGAGVSFDGGEPPLPLLPTLPGIPNMDGTNANYPIASNGTISFTIAVGATSGGYTASTIGISGGAGASYTCDPASFNLHN